MEKEKALDNQHNDNIQNFILKKEYFIASRRQDIRRHYQFFSNLLGRGSYGVVYKAKMLKSPYSIRAVKIIPKALVKNAESLINQTSILKRLDHPNIIKLYETFEDELHFYLVLEYVFVQSSYCEGGQLFNRLSSNGRFSEADAHCIFSQIIKTLKYLHTQKIAHRDLKPQNFLMFSSSSSNLKLIDFGLSYQFEKNMRSQLKSKNKNKLLGTSYYIAPEVIDLNYDQRCDIWSAGVILYIIATATPPFQGSNDDQILQNVAKYNYSLNTPQTKKLSPNLKDLLKRIFVPEQKRLTIDQILNHPWMTQPLPQQSLQLDFKKLKQFCNYTKLKTIAVTFIASQLPEKQIHKLGQIFKQIDQNNDGYLTIQELTRSLQRQKQNTNLMELTSILSTIDTDKNGRINYNQFVACCLQSSVLQNQIYLQSAFKQFDTDQNGTITKAQFKKILESSNLSHEHIGSYIDQILNDCDKDNDGAINYMQFLQSLGYNRQKTPSQQSKQQIREKQHQQQQQQQQQQQKQQQSNNQEEQEQDQQQSQQDQCLSQQQCSQQINYMGNNFDPLQSQIDEQQSYYGPPQQAYNNYEQQQYQHNNKQQQLHHHQQQQQQQINQMQQSLLKHSSQQRIESKSTTTPVVKGNPQPSLMQEQNT